MEDLLTILAEQSNMAGNNQAVNASSATLKHKSPTKYISRRRSVLSLANEWLKPKSGCTHGELTMEIPNNRKPKASLSQFFSLRGSRGKKEKANDSITIRSRSFSPEKKDITGVVVDEYSTMKATRRKSLQDLLGTVTGKISRRQRGMTVENPEQSYERILGDKKYGFESISHNSNVGAEYHHQPPNAASPTHTMDFPSAREVQNQPCIQIGIQHQFEETDPQAVSITPAGDKISTPTSIILNQQIGICAPHISQGHIEDNGIAQRPWTPEPDHCVLIKSARRKSTAPPKELERRGFLSPPSKQSRAPLIDFIKHTSLEAPGFEQIRFEEGTSARHGHNIESTNTATDIIDLDPLFRSRERDREVKYRSIIGEGYSPRLEQSNKEIEDQIELTAAKMSKNLHLSAAQSAWSSDSSDTGTENKSDFSWDGNESEIWTSVARGQKIMSEGKLSPYLHLRPADAATLEPAEAEGQNSDSPQECAKTRKDSHPNISELIGYPDETYGYSSTPTGIGPERGSKKLAAGCFYIQSLDSTSSDWRFSSTTNSYAPNEQEPNFSVTKNHSAPKGKAPDLSFVQPLGSLGSPVSKIGVMYKSNLKALRQRQTLGGNKFGLKGNPRQSSVGPVSVSFPGSEFCTAYTKTYASKSDAIGDLYQNHDNYLDHCLFDRATRTIFPQISGKDLKSCLPTDSQGLELLWLPMEFFPNPRSSGAEDGSPDNSNLRRVSPSEEFHSDHLDKTLNNLHIRDQNTPVWDSEGDCGDPEEIVPLEYSLSTVEHDSNGLDYPEVRISVREISNSIPQGLNCENDQAELVGMGDLYDKTVEGEFATQYIGSTYSSSNDSLLADQKLKPVSPNSAGSVWSKIEDSRAEQAKRVKTWAELGKDFLDIYAPFDQISPEQRAHLAVHNALSIRGGLQNDFATERETPSSDGSVTTRNSNNICQSIRSRDRSSDGDITLHHIEDIARCESAKEKSSQPPGELSTMNGRESGRGQSPEVTSQPPRKHCAEVGNASKSKQTGGLPMSFLSSWAESDEFREKLYTKEKEHAQLISPELNIAMFASGNSQIESSESTFARGHHIEHHWSRARSGTLITSLPENNLTLPYEQSGATEERTSKEASSRRISAEIVACVASQPLGTSNGVIEFPITENQRDDKITNWKWKCLDSAVVNNVASKVAMDMELNQTMQREPIPAHALLEKFDGLPLVQSPLADLDRMNGFVNPAFLDSDPGIQIPRPNIRNVLAPKVLTSDNPGATRHITHESDAETEESENFGEKLRRYECAKQDEKENEEQWWRDFVLYG